MRENGERGSEAGSRAAGHAPRKQAPKNECRDILEEPIAPYRAKRPKTGSVGSQATFGVSAPVGRRHKTTTGAGNKMKDLQVSKVKLSL
jgi:hypothetical protein